MTWQSRIEIPADSPFFLGHFPGHPILPGIAHPVLVVQELADHAGAPAWIAEIPTLKLRNPVRPGDVLDLTLDGPGDDDGLVRFELTRSDERISTGSLRLGHFSGPREVSLPPAFPKPSGDYPPVGSLVPHGHPARLIRDVLDVSYEAFSGVAEIPAESPFVQDGRAPAFLGLEAAAQGAAVLEALSRRDTKGPRIGYLVALRNARCRVPWLPAGSPFRIALRLTGSAAALSIYDAAVEDEHGDALVAGTISTYVPPEG
jgi:3-hydroxyacyl-[acyl-carrier-protein] dehydratase